MLAALLPVGSAVLGGVEGYRRSGGDIGATLLGAGLGAAGGAALPAGIRMAGTALAGTPLMGLVSKAAPEGYKAAQALEALKAGKGLGTAVQAARSAGKAAPMVQQMAGQQALIKGLGGAALIGGGMALPGIAGGLASAAAGPARSTAGRAGGLAVPGMQPGEAVYDGSGAVPGQLPVGASPYGTLDILDPGGPFAAGRTQQLLEGDVQLANMRKIMPELFKAAEARSKTEFQRQMAAAGVRQNIATAANMLERSQQAAQQMGLNAASQMGAALTSQYQYQ